MLAALSVLWGGAFFFNGVAVRELPSFTLAWLRVAVAAMALLLAMRLLRQRMPAGGRVWAAFFGMGLLNNVVPFVLIVWGQHHIASGLASILNATTPLFTVLAAHLLTPDERLTPLKAAGVAVGFAGAVFMVGPDALGGLGTGVMAQLACLAGALAYAFAGISTYVLCTGTLGFVALTTFNDDHERVVWRPGVPLLDRYKRQDERAALDRLAPVLAAHVAAAGGDEAMVQKARSAFGSPLIVAVVSSPVPHPGVPEWEQLLSAGAVCLSLVNAALAAGYGAAWLTGPAADPAFARAHLGLTASERVAGLIHIGTRGPAPVPERPRPDVPARTSFL